MARPVFTETISGLPDGSTLFANAAGDSRFDYRVDEAGRYHVTAHIANTRGQRQPIAPSTASKRQVQRWMREWKAYIRYLAARDQPY